MLLDAGLAPTIPTLPPGASAGQVIAFTALVLLIFVVVTVIAPTVKVWAKLREEDHETRRDERTAAAAHAPRPESCVDCTAVCSELAQIKPAIESAHKAIHARLRELDEGPLDDIQRTASAAGSSAAEARVAVHETRTELKAAIAEVQRENRQKLEEIDKSLVRLLDRSDFRREPTR